SFQPDAVPDWVVGDLESTARPGLGARALAVSTVTRPTLTPDTATAPSSPTDVLSGQYKPTDAPRAQGYLASQYFLLPSYALNAIDVIDPTGQGWAVGEHGAIVGLGISGGGLATGGREPAPPVLRDHEPGALPDGSAYDAFRPLAAAQPGTVPPLLS